MEVHEDFETLSNAAFASAVGFQSVAYSFLPFPVNSPTRCAYETGVHLSLPSFSLRSGQCPNQDGAQEIPLRPQAFALLRYLLEHAPRLVTKKELFERVCADAYGSERSLWVCIGELRKLSGIRRKPRGSVGRSTVGDIDLSPRLPLPHQLLTPQPPNLVGREAELAQRHGFLGNTLQSTRPPPERV